jgi:Carboxypeptidase regulatory-like domain
MTGAEALQKILDKVDKIADDANDLKNIVNELQISVKLIENNIKVLNNRAGVLMRQDTNSFMVPQPQLQGSAPKNTLPLEHKKIMSYNRVFGKLADDKGDPIESVLVKIYDKNNEVCATAETDPIGIWDTMLPPGRYVAEYTKQGFKTSNKTFEVGNKETEVK